MALNQRQIRVVVESINKIFIILKEQNERLKDMGEKQLYVAIFLENGPDGVVMTSHPELSHPAILIHRCDEIFTIKLPPFDKINHKQACDMICHLVNDMIQFLDEDLRQDLFLKFKNDET